MLKFIKIAFITCSLLSCSFNLNSNTISKVFDPSVQDKNDQNIIPRYNFERKLPPCKDRSNVSYTQYNFASFMDFSINLDDYKENTYTTSFKIKRTTAQPFHIEVNMVNESNEKFNLFDRKYTNVTPEEVIDVGVVFDFTKMKAWGEFELCCYRETVKEDKNSLKFFLSKPKEIYQETQEIRLFWAASLRSGILSNQEIRLELYNLPNLIYEKYYLRVPVDKIYMRVFNRKSISYKSCIVYIKDIHGYLKKAYDIVDSRFENYVGNHLAKNSIGYENLNLFSFNYNYYVDQRTHMMSKQKDDFEFAAPSTQFFLPKGKYELYKEVECVLCMTDMFYTGRDLIYPFKVKFLNGNIDERINDKKGNTLSDDIYKKFMKEELL